MKYAEFTRFLSRFVKIVSWDGKDRSYRAAWRLSDAAFVFSSETSGRARARAYTVYQFAIQSSRSLECSLKLFHPNLVFTSFAQFRMGVCLHAYTWVCARARYAYIHIHAFPISLFRKSPLIHLARKRGCCATEIRRLRGLVVRWDAENKRTNGIEMEGRYIQSDCPLLSRHSCERIGNRLQITLVIYCWCIGKRISFCILRNDSLKME